APALAPAPAPTLARSTFTAPARPAGATPAAAPFAPERDRHELYEDLYETFIERLRRDLLHERERNGHLVDGLF
ncbi:MAG: hypothetical protein ACRDLS_14955, partial [Solirubrobacteraceae bacterium]